MLGHRRAVHTSVNVHSLARCPLHKANPKEYSCMLARKHFTQMATISVLATSSLTLAVRRAWTLQASVFAIVSMKNYHMQVTIHRHPSLDCTIAISNSSNSRMRSTPNRTFSPKTSKDPRQGIKSMTYHRRMTRQALLQL